MEVYLLVLFAYLLGSVPTGYILGSAAGVDIRKAGSGNVGATNVARVVGKRYGILTLVADIAKGFVPVIVALNIGLAPDGDSLCRDRCVPRSFVSSFFAVAGRKGSCHGSGGFLGAGTLGHTSLDGNFCSGPSGHPRCLSKFNGGCCLRPHCILAIFLLSDIDRHELIYCRHDCPTPPRQHSTLAVRYGTAVRHL